MADASILVYSGYFISPGKATTRLSLPRAKGTVHRAVYIVIVFVLLSQGMRANASIPSVTRGQAVPKVADRTLLVPGLSLIAQGDDATLHLTPGLGL